MKKSRFGCKFAHIGFLVCLTILNALSWSASADWQGSVEGGTALQENGTSTRLRFNLQNNDRPLNHKVYVDWYRTNTGDNSYAVGYVPRYWFTDALYVFGEAKYRIDKPLLIDRDTLLLLGVGYLFIADDTQSLWAEAGIGHRQTEFSNSVSNDEALATARAGYSRKLADLVRVDFDGDIVEGELHSESTVEAGIAVKLYGGAIKVSYRTRRFQLGLQDAITDSGTFVSYDYGF